MKKRFEAKLVFPEKGSSRSMYVVRMRELEANLEKER